MEIFGCVSILVISFGFASSANVPDYIHRCHRSDPDVTKCIQNSIELIRPQLAEGLPEIGVPGIDPFKLNEIIIFDGKDNNNLKASLENVEVKGAGNFIITKLKLDIEKMTYRVGVRIDHLDIQGDYNVDVRVLVAPISGTGKFHANATGVEGHALIQAGLDGKFLRFETIDFKFAIKDYNIHLDNLFNGDPVLSQAANQLLNSNKEELIRLSIPFIERKASEIFLNLSNKITYNLDYNEIFPI